MGKMFVAVLIVVLAGCATRGMGDQYRPIVDMQGKDANQFEQDLRQCQSYSAQATGAGTNAAGGALAGALLGAVLAKAAGSNYDWQGTARVGAVAGAASGAAHGENDQRNIIRKCLAGRGYSVLQ
jgi:outer membrane lipoprotein SlyB